jgi:riboflavin synthase
MFTGIVKAVGVVDRLQEVGGDLRITVRADDFPWQRLNIGDSISVNGACLTAVAFSGTAFTADVSQETISVTALSALDAGSHVNLEPALAVGDALGGHFVSGHVDCTGTVSAIEKDARSLRLHVELPAAYRRYAAPKGSICIDGVSLTINDVSASGVELNIIPHTAEQTIIGDYVTGCLVNVEVDLLARYLERLLTPADDGGISRDFLEAHGYG